MVFLTPSVFLLQSVREGSPCSKTLHFSSRNRSMSSSLMLLQPFVLCFISAAQWPQPSSFTWVITGKDHWTHRSLTIGVFPYYWTCLWRTRAQCLIVADWHYTAAETSQECETYHVFIVPLRVFCLHLNHFCFPSWPAYSLDERFLFLLQGTNPFHEKRVWDWSRTGLQWLSVSFLEFDDSETAGGREEV